MNPILLRIKNFFSFSGMDENPENKRRFTTASQGVAGTINGSPVREYNSTLTFTSPFQVEYVGVNGSLLQVESPKKDTTAHPLEGSGFNFEKSNLADKIVCILDKIKWYDYLFKTEQWKAFREMIYDYKDENWYKESRDLRNQKPITTSIEITMPRYFEEKRRNKVLPMSYAAGRWIIQFYPDEKEIENSKWKFYLTRDANTNILNEDDLIIESDIKTILGEDISEQNIKELCSQSFANTMFQMLEAEGYHRVHYYLTGKVLDDITQENKRDIIHIESRLNGI